MLKVLSENSFAHPQELSLPYPRIEIRAADDAQERVSAAFSFFVICHGELFDAVPSGNVSKMEVEKIPN
jgi:hypothetical protein